MVAVSSKNARRQGRKLASKLLVTHL